MNRPTSPTCWLSIASGSSRRARTRSEDLDEQGARASIAPQILIEARMLEIEKFLNEDLEANGRPAEDAEQRLAARSGPVAEVQAKGLRMLHLLLPRPSRPGRA